MDVKLKLLFLLGELQVKLAQLLPHITELVIKGILVDSRTLFDFNLHYLELGLTASYLLADLLQDVFLLRQARLHNHIDL